MTITNDQGNKNTKWIWIGLGAAVFFCLCAVAVAFFVFYRVGKTVEQGANPVAAAKAAHEIVDYDLPTGYREQMSVNIMVYSFVIIAPETSITKKPMIMLAQFKSTANPEQMKQQLRQSFEQQSGNQGTNMKLVDVKKMTIRGEETDVATYEGTDNAGNDMRQLITSFNGKNGTALLMVMGTVQGWDQKTIDSFIKSIR